MEDLVMGTQAKRSQGGARFRALAGRAMASPVFRGSAASFIGLVVYSLFQIASVPILSAGFGVAGYGIWMLIWAIPSYFALADLGLAATAANDLTMKWSAGDHAGSVRVLQSVSIAILLVCGVVVAFISGYVAIAQIVPVMLSDTLRPHGAAIVMLTIWSAAMMLSGLPNAILRATGYFPRASLLWDGAACVEWVVLLVVAHISRDINTTAASLMLIRVGTGIAMYWQARRLRPELYFGWRHVDRSELTRLMPAAIGVMAIPLALALNLQGTIVIIGSFLGPAAVALLVPVRTISRLVLQVLGALNRAVVPEIARAYGRNDTETRQRLWSLYRRFALVALTTAALGCGMIGAEVVALWTGGRIQPQHLVVALVAIDLVPHGWWYLNTMLLTATNEHVGGTGRIFLVTAVGGVVAIILTKYMGIAGTLLGFLLADVVLALMIEGYVRRKIFASSI